MHRLLLTRGYPNLHRTYITREARHFASSSKISAKAPEPPKFTDSPSTSTQPSSDSKAEVIPPSSTSLSLDFSPASDQESEPTHRTGARSSKDSLSSIERRRRYLGRATLIALGLGLLVEGFYLGNDWEEDELKSMRLRREDAPSTRFGRTKARFTGLFDYFVKPSWEELLPAPVPPFAKPYTLVLSIDDLLVTSTWDRVNGWRTAKRPGVDYFLAYLSQFYEIVVFTSQNSYTAIPVLEKLDPYNFYITYKLFRESTRSVNGSIRKDLSYLNRDLSKVVIMDTRAEHVALQPENSIIIPKWTGDPSDKGLVSMIPFLESIAIYKPGDVRPILEAYQGKNIPVEYAKKEDQAKQQFLEDWRRSGKGKVSTSSFTLSGLFGSEARGPTPPEPLTYLEHKRKEAQQHYREEQQYIQTNKAYFDRLLEEDRQAAAAQMSGSLWSLLSGGVQGPPMPQEKGKQDDVNVPVQNGDNASVASVVKRPNTV